MDRGTDSQEEFHWKTKTSSPFRSEFFHHKLVDYCDSTLSPEESREILKWLGSHPEYQGKLDFIRSLRTDLQKLNHIEFSEKVVNDITQTKSYLPFVVERLKVRQWPPLFRWAAEALVVVFVMVLALVVIPWEDSVKKWLIKSPQSVILAEFEKGPTPQEPVDSAQFQDELEKPNESAKATNTTKPAEAPKSATQVAVQPSSPNSVAKVQPAQPGDALIKAAMDSTKMAGASSIPVKNLKAPAPPPPPPSTPTSGTANQPAATATKPATAVSTAEVDEKVGGFLFRGEVKVTNVESVWPKIRDRIQDIGGRKAGEVELGWKKSAALRYFHFTVPEAQLGVLKDFIGQYGQLQLVKEKHTRIMPDGIIRIILNVNEGRPAGSSQSPTSVPTTSPEGIESEPATEPGQ